MATVRMLFTFSAINHVNTKLRNKMGDQYLSDCLITFIKLMSFSDVSATKISLNASKNHEMACEVLVSIITIYKI